MKDKKDWSWRKIFTIFVLIVCMVWFIWAVEVLPATFFKFTYPSVDGLSGRFIVTDESSGDSIVGGVLTETERAAMTFWKGSASLDPGSYTVEGFIFESSDTSTGAYRVVILLEDNDSLIIDQSSLEDMTVATVTDVTNQVTADVTAISGDAGAADSLEEACDGYDDAGLTLFERIAAALDSLNNHDNWVAQQADLDGLVMYFGACDGCYQVLYPRSGTVNKDSVVIIDPSLGNDSLVGKIVFYHGTTPSVYDSAYFYVDEPW